MGSDVSSWQETVDIKQKFPQLKDPLEVDVLIIGAGITGITTAYLLSKTKLKVALIEKAVIHANSATAFTTAFITQVADTDLSILADIFGPRRAKLVWESGAEAINFIEKTAKKEKIACDFTRCSDYSYTVKSSEVKGYKEEAAYARKLGFDVSFHEENDLNLPNFGYMEIKNQAKFHPLKYLNGLIAVARKNGVLIFENTEALKINEQKDIVIVETRDTMISAKHIVMATYSPFTHPLEMYFKGGLYTTYILEAQIPKKHFKEGIYEDSNSPYHYFRIDPGKKFDTIIIGGEDHREDLPIDPQKCFNALEKYLGDILTGAKYKIVRHWTGPILEPIDGLPYIGRFKKRSRQLVTHGFSGTGMTFGTISAIIFRDTILGKKNTWGTLYDAARLPTLKQLIVKGRDYSEELVGGAVKNTFRSA